MRVRRKVATLLFLAVGLGSAVLIRGRIRDERRALELVPRALLEEVAGAREAMAGRQVILLSAGLGVLRAVALDFLWLRAVHLQENGEYFEAGALARLITALEPRLPEIWNFQARNLAYNIPPSFPLHERYAWVVQGIQLLRDGALLHNPEDPSVLLDLAFIFQHKIGLDFDDAGHLYRAALAAAFEVGRESEPGLELWREWRLDPRKVQNLETKLGLTLDFRAAESHALYWAEIGLSRAPDPGSWLRHRLDYVRAAALRQLFDGGRPVRAPGGAVYAFVPDLRFLEPVERVLRGDIEKARSPEERIPVLAAFEATAAVYLFLSGDEPGAQARFEVAGAGLDPMPATLEDLLVSWATAQGQKPEATAIDDCLDASLLLERSGDRGLVDGLRKLARILDARRPRKNGAPATTFEERLRAAVLRREARELPGELPFRLELLAAGEREPDRNNQAPEGPKGRD